MKSLSLRVLCLLAAAAILPSCFEGGSVNSQALIAPSTLTALAASDGSAIDLTWLDMSDNETGFRVDVAPGPITVDSDATEFTILPVNTTSYFYPTQPNTTRYFRVLAVTATNQSDPSNVVSATTPNVPPPPQRFDALVGPSGSDMVVSLLWDDVTGETGYTIERGDNGGAFVTLTSVGVNVTSYTDSSTTTNGNYVYRIRANNANGSGPWSPAVHAETRNTSWEIQSTPPSGDISWFTSLAVAPSGNSYISSYDASMGLVASSVAGLGGSLSTTDINPGFPATIGYSGTSIAVDTSEFSHIVANDSFANVLRHLTNAPSGTWISETIDSPTQATDKALIKIGPSNSLHVVYQHQNSGMISGLRYGVRGSTTWTTEWIVTSDPTDYFAFIVDGAGTTHLAYRRPKSGGGYELVYAQRVSGSWSFTILPTSGSPETCSIALDPSGAVYIAYNSLTTGGLNLLKNLGGSWTDEVVHQSPLARWGRYNSIAIDSATGEIHLAYQEAIYTSLRYASKMPGGGWIYQHVDGSGDVGRFASVGTNSNGNVFVAYGDATNQRVKLGRTALRPPANFIAKPISTTRVDLSWNDVPNEQYYRLERSEDNGAVWTTLAILNANTLSYSDTLVLSSQLYSYRVIAVNDFGESSPSNVSSTLPLYVTSIVFPGSTSYGLSTDIAVGPGDVLHVSSMDQTNTNQLYTTGPTGGPFSTVTADSGPSASSQIGFGSTGIALSGSTPILTALLAGSSSPAGLRFTTMTGLTPSNITLEASTTVPFSIVGNYPKVRVAANGVVHILHVEQGDYLRHQFRNGATWTNAGRITPLETGVASAYNNNFAIDSNSIPHVAYIRRAPNPATNTQLVYGSKQAGAWSFALVPGPVNPFYPSLALDASNKAHVAVVDNGNSVVYGTNASGSWIFETVEPSIFSVANGNPAIAVDPATGRIHLAYVNSGLRYARKDPGGSWVKLPLDTTTGVAWIAMGLGSSGMIHLAYQDFTYSRLKIMNAKP